MKNYKEMADAVFARRDEYVAGVKRKKKIADGYYLIAFLPYRPNLRK